MDAVASAVGRMGGLVSLPDRAEGAAAEWGVRVDADERGTPADRAGSVPATVMVWDRSSPRLPGPFVGAESAWPVPADPEEVSSWASAAATAAGAARKSPTANAAAPARRALLLRACLFRVLLQFLDIAVNLPQRSRVLGAASTKKENTVIGSR